MTGTTADAVPLLTRSCPLRASRAAGAALWKKVAHQRGRRVFLLLVAVALLNIFDLLMTIRASRDGIMHEGNPVARAVLGHSITALTLFKISVVCAASFVLYRCRRFRCAEIASGVVCTVYAGVALQWRLCYDMYEVAINGGNGSEGVARVDALLRLVPTL